MAGQVDAVIGAYRNFELNQMEIEGVPGRCFYLEEEGLPAYDELIYVANPETMDRDKIARFLAATEKGVGVHRQPSAGELGDLRRDLGRARRRAERESVGRHDPALRAAARPRSARGGIARFEQFLHEAGLIDSVNDVSKIAIDVTAE